MRHFSVILARVVRNLSKPVPDRSVSSGPIVYNSLRKQAPIDFDRRIEEGARRGRRPPDGVKRELRNISTKIHLL
jgi:hypothetical protein